MDIEHKYKKALHFGLLITCPRNYPLVFDFNHQPFN
ncbi:hypothetical protein B6N60_02687 [Richelia sinica FACHB-800]|uniref:Uncharacterized protein n=1 Tax=Richelia sinica FACHB-800 TaxID=1357546 RepID=A0A975Y589_9NOST|nr:hypothetical protein B6N60_02687 [Richelia sinica FACHB-800]